MEIIPALDIIDGKCVRLRQGNYSSCKIYADSPLEQAKEFERAGFRRLHLVDLDGARSGKATNMDVLEKICSRTALKVDFGGGVKSDDDISRVFDAGAEYVCIGSMAQTDVEKTSAWLELYGGEKIIIGADVWNGKVCINGWKKVTDMTIPELIRQYGGLIKNLMCTDIRKDGMLEGPAFGLYREILRDYPDVRLIASGGVSDRNDLEELRLQGIEAVIVGKAFYEGRIGLNECTNL